MAVSPRGKRKIIVRDRLFFWFVRKNNDGIPRLHIISDDKKLRTERALFDTEIPVTPEEVRKVIEEWIEEGNLTENFEISH